MAGQVVVVASGKGGVGKTTTVTNLGVALRRSNHPVALVDADLGMANLGPMLGISGDPTLHDVLAGTAALDEALVTETTGFAVLPGSKELTAFSEADPSGLRAVLESLAEDYEFVLVDTGAGLTHEGVLPLGLADQVLLVTSPDPAAVENTRKTAELTDLADGHIAGVVVTKVDETVNAEEIAAGIGGELLGAVPFDPTVRRSTAAGEPLEAVDPDSPAAEAYRELARVLTAEPAAPQGATGETVTTPTSPDAQRDATGEPGQADEAEPPGAAGSADEPPEPAPESGADGPEDAPAAPTAEPTDRGPDSTADVDEPAAESTTADETATETGDSPPASAAGNDVDAGQPADEGSDEPAEDESSRPASDETGEPPDRETPERRGGILGWLGRLFR